MRYVATPHSLHQKLEALILLLPLGLVELTAQPVGKERLIALIGEVEAAMIGVEEVGPAEAGIGTEISIPLAFQYPDMNRIVGIGLGDGTIWGLSLPQKHHREPKVGKHGPKLAHIPRLRNTIDRNSLNSDAELHVLDLFVAGVGVEVVGRAPVELVALAQFATDHQAECHRAQARGDPADGAQNRRFLDLGNRVGDGFRGACCDRLG